MLIERYRSLSPELSHQVREMKIRSRYGRKTKETMCLKSHLKNMAESRKLEELKKDVHYSYVLVEVHTLIIEKGGANASFLK